MIPEDTDSKGLFPVSKKRTVQFTDGRLASKHLHGVGVGLRRGVPSVMKSCGTSNLIQLAVTEKVHACEASQVVPAVNSGFHCVSKRCGEGRRPNSFHKCSQERSTWSICSIECTSSKAEITAPAYSGRRGFGCCSQKPHGAADDLGIVDL